MDWRSKIVLSNILEKREQHGYDIEKMQKAISLRPVVLAENCFQ